MSEETLLMRAVEETYDVTDPEIGVISFKVVIENDKLSRLLIMLRDQFIELDGKTVKHLKVILDMLSRRGKI